MTDLVFNFSRHDNGRLVWTCVGPKGAYHIWAQIVPPENQSALIDFCYGGVEVHYPSKPYDFSPDDPPIKNCWLTGCDCWPDGSSLQFEEQIKPMIEPVLDRPEVLNEFMYSEMAARYKDTFGDTE